MPSAPVIHSSSDLHCVASWNGLIVQLWIKATPLSGVRDLRPLARQMGDTLKGTLIVLLRDADVPNEAARAVFAAFAREAVPRMARSAMVYEGDGFRASVVRSIMVGLSFFAPPGTRYKIFSTVPHAAAWIAEEPTLNTDAASLAAVVRELLREHGK